MNAIGPLILSGVVTAKIQVPLMIALSGRVAVGN